MGIGFGIKGLRLAGVAAGYTGGYVFDKFYHRLKDKNEKF